MKLGVAMACVALFLAIPLAAQDAYLPSDRVTAPKLITGGKPTYTSEAMLARIGGIEGTVVLQIDVLTDGTVGTVALVKSLDPKLDQSAAKSVKQWRYEPGTRDGRPVVVRIIVEYPFGQKPR
ncbi:MAG TPA: energy transducer TonB [Vicinamibacterales bacterium]